MYWLFGMLIPFVVGFLFGLIFPLLPLAMTADQWLAAFLLLSVLVAWVGFAITSRRLHDFGTSAWWVLPLFVAALALGMLGYVRVAQVMGLVWAVVLGSVPGNRGPNRYGPDPKGESSAVGVREAT